MPPRPSLLHPTAPLRGRTRLKERSLPRYCTCRSFLRTLLAYAPSSPSSLYHPHVVAWGFALGPKPRPCCAALPPHVPRPAKVSRLPDSDLRKRLKVVFRGEDGVDEGGVTKEFFQLLTVQVRTSGNAHGPSPLGASIVLCCAVYFVDAVNGFRSV